MIKRIELINFMSHQHSVIEPDEGLTVLCGPNNCGKSAIVVALQILAHNDRSNFVLRHEEKNCQIIVETQEGHVIEWSRKKNGSAKYTIDGVLYDRLNGKSPPILAELLRLPRVGSKSDKVDVHFGEQKQPIFLLNDKARTAADFFASSSDATRLMEMQSLHKSKVSDAKRDQKRLDKESLQLEGLLEVLNPVNEIEKRIETSEKEYVEISEADQEILALSGFLSEVERASRNLHFRECEVVAMEVLLHPPTVQPTDEIELLARRLREIRKLESDKAIECEVLAKLQTLPALGDERELHELLCELRLVARLLQSQTDIDQVFAQLDSCPEFCDLDSLAEIVDELKAIQKRVDALDEVLGRLVLELDQTSKQLHAWAEENPVCPTCLGPVDSERLVSIGIQKGKDD